MKPPVARKLAVGHMCLTASFLLTGGFKFNYFKMYAWSVYKHAFVAAFMLSMVKMLLKEEVGGSALNSHGNYIADRGKSWKNHGIVYLNFCGNPEYRLMERNVILQFYSVNSAYMY